jgi:hypothetical protein
VLHGLRAGALADAGERDFALVAIERRRAHLDQLVVRKGAVDLGDDGIGEAFAAELQDRVQRVRARLQRLSLRGIELAHRASIRSATDGQIEQGLAAPPRY